MNYRQRVNPFTFEGVLEVLKRNALRACVTISAGILISLIFYYRVQAVYSSEMKIFIPSNYLSLLARSQGAPMIPDAELDSYRIALVRSVLSDPFLDGLGERYDIFREALDAPKHSIERQSFRTRFSIESSSSSNVKISVTGSSPEEASGILDDTLKEIRKVLLHRITVENDLSEDKVASIIQEPSIPEMPLSPHKKDFVLIGFFLGVLTALCQLVYHEYKLSQFLYPEEIAAVLGVEFLGELPEVSRVNWLYLIDHVKSSRQKLLT